ncbi:hydroxymethylglutaryl-CoA lyase [Fulvivirga sedimenti]|uniref:Hydroxymethylglutaryl-CoA lyase n=1 Tax=Fulvivirga sedimenti TaxID=2879465 RepID=A0A9X1L061_9BACT|nr:hydroxymethylglutaryl-CoA lyase [Fulvivirga sedimenti]MCA6079145.1 hydroxymethylglutaryl-CoA lyase [Fulvivirga sedimenti]
MVKLIECPRDAMQGLESFVPTFQKVSYLNSLLRVGFDTLDFGSFVSPKAIPQMKDTAEVLAQLDLSSTSTKLLAIIANVRGAEEAAMHNEIEFLGFPFSISETFQLRNTNQRIDQAYDTVDTILEICAKKERQLVAYLSMGFGNPYGDPYSEDIVLEHIRALTTRGVQILSLSDTIGNASDQLISSTFTRVRLEFPDLELGVHLHARPQDAYSRIQSAFKAGCRRFDGALRGFGGCPMAKDDLVGNVATETIIECLQDAGVSLAIDQPALESAMKKSVDVFG